MEKGIIRLCYRKIIGHQSVSPWEKLVFEDTYAEFRMQMQYFNQQKKYSTFSELIHEVPGAAQLHFLVSSAAIGYIKQLNNKVPDVVNGLGMIFLPFENFRFEIIESDTKNKERHQVAINFVTDPLTWHDTVDNRLLLSLPGNTDKEETLTHMITLQPFVSIYSLKSFYA